MLRKYFQSKRIKQRAVFISEASKFDMACVWTFGRMNQAHLLAIVYRYFATFSCITNGEIGFRS